MAAMLEALRARAAAAAAGEPWSDSVPGDWVTGDRILDVTLLPIACAFGFVVVRRMLVSYLFEVRAAPRGARLVRTRAACARLRARPQPRPAPPSAARPRRRGPRARPSSRPPESTHRQRARARAPQPSGMAVMTARMKKSDGKWDDRKQGEFLRKWNESCWKCFVYVFFTAFAFLVGVPARGGRTCEGGCAEAAACRRPCVGGRVRRRPWGRGRGEAAA